MREFFVGILSATEGSIEITLFSVWHILYWILIFGGSIGAAFLLKNKSQQTKTRVLVILAWLVPAVYILDFFCMPLAREDFTIDVDKLPFHICTLMSFFIAFAQFNKNFEKIKDAICCMSLVASLMYITYPGSALGGVTPWCYRVVQTMVYHGLMFAWGLLSLTTGAIKIEFRTLWKSLVGIAIVILWASFGNAVYSNPDHHYDWFFVTGSTFPFVPEWLMPFAVFVAVGGMCAIIHAIDLGVKKYYAKKTVVAVSAVETEEVATVETETLAEAAVTEE